jgi:hypothetical protein
MSLFYPQDLAANLSHDDVALRSDRSSDFRIILVTAPSHPTEDEQWHLAVFVSDYSGGPVPEFHGVPN